MKKIKQARLAIENFVKKNKTAKLSDVQKRFHSKITNEELQLAKDKVVYGINTEKLVEQFKKGTAPPFASFMTMFPNCPQWRYYGLKRVAMTGQSGYKQKGVAKKSSVVTILGSIDVNSDASKVRKICEQVLGVLDTGGALSQRVSIVELANPKQLEFRMK